MAFDFNRHATLVGTAPGEHRGGKIAEGNMMEMYQFGVDYIEQGYIGIMLMVDDASYRPSELRKFVGQ